MVDFARIQNRIYYGYTKASIRLGTSHAIYRPQSLINPIQAAYHLKDALIGVDQNYKYTSAKKYGDPLWQILPEEGLTLQNYDYILGSTVTYFIVDIAPEDRLSPPIVVECNTTITIRHPTGTLSPGRNDYQQYQPQNPDAYVQNCPVSLLQHGRSDSSNLKLPTSVRLPSYSILMPEFDGLIVKAGDEIEDASGRRLIVNSAERNKKSLGFRIIAYEQGV